MPVIVSQSLPSPLADNAGVGQPNRGDRYGEQFVTQMGVTKHPLAQEGSYFVATNPTPGTGLASGVIAAYSATAAGLLTMYNNDVANGKNIFLDYLKVIPTVAPASGTAMHFAVWVDKQNLYASGGTAITPVNTSSLSARSSINLVNSASGGTVVTNNALAAATKRLVGRGVARSVIPAVGEEIIIASGDDPSSGSSSGTTAGRSCTTIAPVILAPGWGLVVVVWFPSNSVTGLSYELESAWYER